MDDDFKEDEKQFASQKVEKIALQVITSVVEKKTAAKLHLYIWTKKKEEKILKKRKI